MSFAGFQGQEAKDFDWGWLKMDPPAAGWGPSPDRASVSPAEAETDPDVEAFEALQEDRRGTAAQRQLEEAADLAGADSVDIKGESDAAIGADGKKIQNYIQQEEAIVSRQLDLGGDYRRQS